MNERRLRLAGMVTMTFGLLALLGWIFGWMQLASFGANRIPMAPSTAALFLLYGAAIGVRARTPLSRHAHGLSVALVGVGMLVALVLFTLGWQQIRWAGEHLGLNIIGMVDSAAIGHMSPVTAFCFLLVGVSFLASLSPSAIGPWRVGVALVSAAGLLVTSFVFLLAYSFGTPLLYGTTFIPPALNTILAFSTLGLALLAFAGRTGDQFRGVLGDDSKPALVFVVIFFLLALGIVGAGYAYYRKVERHFRAEAEQQLSSTADLKVEELTQFRKERLRDAALFHKNPAFTHLVHGFLAPSAGADTQRQLEVWLGKYQGHSQYDEVRLLDPQGITRLSAPAGLLPVSSAVSRSASEALRSGQVIFQDFYRSEHDQRIYLALLIPLLDESDGHRPLGVLVLRIDPSSYLYPSISRWPVPSETAETLLVRREGNEVVFLNELRFKTNTSLTLRRSLANTTLPAAIAALGNEGIVVGLDYRGVAVLAAVRAVPDSPWFLVARRDLSEVYAPPLRTQLWQVTALVCVLLFGAGAGVGLAWRQQRVRYYRERAASAESLQRSQSLLAQAEKLGKVGGWEFDVDTRRMTWTEAVYDIHELDSTAQPTVEQGISFYTPASRPIIERAVQRAIEQGEPFDAELEIITAKGNRRTVHTVGRLDLPRRKVAGFFQDITERKQADAERQKLAMVADSSSEFIGMCDLELQPLYVNPAGIRMVGLPDMAAACQAKVPDYFFPEDQRFIAEEFFPRVLRDGHGDVEIRLRHFQTGEPIWVFYSLFSVRDGSGEIVGWATVSRDITERRQAEVALRQSRQAALNLMTDAIEARDQSEQASRALRASEERYRTLFTSMMEGFCLFEVRFDEQDRPNDLLFLEINPAFEAQTGLRNVQGKWTRDVVPQLEAYWYELYGKVAVTGEPAQFENEAKELHRWFAVSTYRVGGQDSRKVGVLFHDITERKRAEAAFVALNAHLEARVVERTAQLQEANKELESFSYSVSHDLRAPLRAIDGFARILEEDYSPRLNDEGRRLLDVIRQNSLRMAQLIDDLLMFSRTGRHTLQPARIAMAEMATTVFQEIVPEQARGRYEFSCGSLPNFVGDSALMRQVWANLIGNAAKFTGRREHPTISIAAYEVANEMVYEVSDNGAGFDMRYAHKLFGVFQRLHSSEEFDGTGVGLALVARIVHKHGGRVWARATPGQGAVFSFALPISEVRDE